MRLLQQLETPSKIVRAKQIALDNLDEIVSFLLPYVTTTPRYWLLSDIHTPCAGRAGSMWIYRTGDKRGGWVDAGNHATARKSGDVLHLIKEKLGHNNINETADWVIFYYA
ncbi:MAG: hypothetical protein VKJ09_15660 [Leptolyngbya sp.]|nr:hypothetical protein [Leptolyngbya sp.]